MTVTPATPFTVDTSGRSVGVRFLLPLHDDTEYTVRIDDVEGLGGGPAATLTETFRHPADRGVPAARAASRATPSSAPT